MQLPDIEYPAPADALPDILSADTIPSQAQIASLQLVSEDRDDWHDLDAARVALATVLTTRYGVVSDSSPGHTAGPL